MSNTVPIPSLGKALVPCVTFLSVVREVTRLSSHLFFVFDTQVSKLTDHKENLGYPLPSAC